MNTRLLLIHALSPIHCGTGQAIGGIDLPILREKPTNIPLVPGSTIKGVLRSMTGAGPLHPAVFGPDTENASDNAGSVQFSDANLVFLPVRSIRGTFAWVTSPYILRRFARDAREAGVKLAALPAEPEETVALVTGPTLQADNKVVFEDLDFTARVDGALGGFAEQLAVGLFGSGGEAKAERDHFQARVCVLHEDVMALLLQTSTEITARIRLESETKTVAQGALWSEEALPVESVLAGLTVATPIKQKNGDVPRPAELLEHVKGLVDRGAVQLGGKASVGRGICRVRMLGGKG
jgi:CRISPR-associated protein Cmr4